MIKSTCVSGIGYDVDSKELYVDLIKGDAKLTYLDVPELVYIEFVNAESKGKYYNAYIREKYEFITR